ncbi:MAG: MlaD family protein [Verrucomicrobiia bacterium]
MNESWLEVKVGFFVILGLALLGVTVVWFGKFETYFKPTYSVTVEFPDASGLLKNSQVLYRGAKVGFVAERPEIAEGGRVVRVLCKINQDVRIDAKAQFKVGVYGLLGDRFVDIVPPSEPSGVEVEPGAVVRGSRTAGIGDLAERIEPVLEEIKPTVKQIREITENINEKFVTDALAADLHEAVRTSKALVQRLDEIVAKMQSGESAVGKFFGDQAFAAQLEGIARDVAGLVNSLRRRGVLFYRDVSEEPEVESPAVPRRPIRTPPAWQAQ